MKLDSYLYTNKGGRDYNEDSIAFQEKDGCGIFVVADGLGGHSKGEVASKCVTDFLVRSWTDREIQENTDFNGKAGHSVEPDLSMWLKSQFALANQKILSLQQQQQCKMKSTAVALIIDETSAAWAHSGDSRLYYFHKNRIEDITGDHSVSYKKYKSGEITRAQIAQDEDQSCLLRTLGSEERWEPDICMKKDLLEAGDAFLLCSDGFWEYLCDEEMLIDLLKAETAKEWAELLLLRVIARLDGENDNLSLLTVMVDRNNSENEGSFL